MSEPCCTVLVTAGNTEEAELIATTVVTERLAACCNMIPAIKSIYQWKGEICRDEEILLIMKTPRTKFETLRKRVVALHSYEVRLRVCATFRILCGAFS